ncbi:hypothetical protein BSG1_14859 [Bacillus sp. SG-1]|nr:hypothetical protein BSG1_14859 [Bacillus sp. SG-1]
MLLVGLLIGCSSNETEEQASEENSTNEQPQEEVNEEPKEEVSEEESTEESEESSIDTSVFVYATNVDITDARDITKHITATVYMNDELKGGLAAQHVLSQTYDFLQQEDIKGAETLTVGVMVKDKRVLQYTVDLAKFVPNDSEPMTDVVLAASEVEKISPEVEEFANAFEWKMN